MANVTSNSLDSGDLGILAESTSCGLLQIYSDISMDDEISGRHDSHRGAVDDDSSLYSYRREALRFFGYYLYDDYGNNSYDSCDCYEMIENENSDFLKRQGSTAKSLFQNKLPAQESHWKIIRESYHEDIPLAYWLSLGKGRDYAVAMKRLQDRLEELTRKLFRCRSRWGRMTISLDPDEELYYDNEFLFYHKKLHSRWQMLFHAMGGSIFWSGFHVDSIEMPKILLDMMSSAMNGTQQFRAHMYSVSFTNNRFGRKEIMDVASFLDDNEFLNSLVLAHSKIDSLESAARFSNAVRNHPNLKKLDLDHCSIGRNTRILSMITNACLNLKELSLSNNCIRSRGAAIVSDFIASNPPFLKEFTLHQYFERHQNKFESSDYFADLLAEALKTNTNLEMLRFHRNIYGTSRQAGAKAFNAVIFDYTDLNSMVLSNHTCSVSFSFDSSDSRAIKQMSIENKKFRALTTSTPGCDVHFPYFDDVPVELMPKVLEWLQEVPKEYSTPLNMVFETMRGWMMPSIYDGRCNSSESGGRAQRMKDGKHRTPRGSSRKPKKLRK